MLQSVKLALLTHGSDTVGPGEEVFAIRSGSISASRSELARLDSEGVSLSASLNSAKSMETGRIAVQNWALPSSMFEDRLAISRIAKNCRGSWQHFAQTLNDLHRFQRTCTSRSFSPSPNEMATTPSEGQPSPSRVRAAAAQWESAVKDDESKVSPSASYRSITASGSQDTSVTTFDSSATSPSSLKPSLSDVDVEESPVVETFAEVSLETTPVVAISAGTPKLSVAVPDPESARPAQGASTLETTRSASGSSQSGWRSTVSSLFVRTSSYSSPTNTAGPSRPPRESGISPLNTLPGRTKDRVPSRDRRLSRPAFGDGYARVRDEMESAAREMRKDDQGESDIDWTFWGAVVQDYEEAARSNPKALSKAIQRGVPDVIRGSVWQLIASSKSTELEESYKALLKLPSPHEKAIAKDLNRTFPDHKYFQQEGGQETLANVIKAYSL